MASKKKVPTRSIRIDMPDELRPIYDVCQAALDEILSTDSLHQTLSALTMTKNRQTNREEIVSVVGAVWDKYKTRVPSQARYGRILFRHIENMLKSRSRGGGYVHRT